MMVEEKVRDRGYASKEPHVVYVDLHWWVDTLEPRRRTQNPQRRLHFALQPPATTLLQLKVIGNMAKTRYTVHCVQAVDPHQALALDHPEALMLCGLLRDLLIKMTEKSVPVIETHLLDLGTAYHVAGASDAPYNDGRLDNFGDKKHVWGSKGPAGSGPGESE